MELCDWPDAADCDPDALDDPLDELDPFVLVEDVLDVVAVVPLPLCVAARHPPRATNPVTLNAVRTRRAFQAGDRRRAGVAAGREVHVRGVCAASMPASIDRAAVGALCRCWGVA